MGFHVYLVVCAASFVVIGRSRVISHSVLVFCIESLMYHGRVSQAFGSHNCMFLFYTVVQVLQCCLCCIAELCGCCVVFLCVMMRALVSFSVVPGELSVAYVLEQVLILGDGRLLVFAHRGLVLDCFLCSVLWCAITVCHGAAWVLVMLYETPWR